MIEKASNNDIALAAINNLCTHSSIYGSAQRKKIPVGLDRVKKLSFMVNDDDDIIFLFSFTSTLPVGRCKDIKVCTLVGYVSDQSTDS